MKLNIFGQVVPVYKEKGLTEKTGTMGHYDFVNKCICIDAELVGDKYMETLIHEIVHALWHRAGLHQTLVSHGIQEVVAEQIAVALTENFKFRLK